MKKSLLAIGSLLLCVGVPAQIVHFSEDFEGGSVPSGWTAQGSWTVSTAASQSTPNFPILAHSNFAVCNDFAASTVANSNVLLSSPVINLSTATIVYLKYDSYFLAGTTWNGHETAIVNYSTDGGTTWSTAGSFPVSATWQTTGINLTAQLAGQSNVRIAFVYDDGSDWTYGACVDNVMLYEPTSHEATLSTVTPVTGSPQAYVVQNNNIPLGGSFTNTGLNPITAITIKWNDGANTFTTNLSSLNVAPFTSYTFTCTTPFLVPSAGTFNITMWIELSGDNNHTDDTSGTALEGVLFLPVHHVTIEEITGTWCTWCPRGAVFMDSMNTVHPNTTHLIAIQDAPMEDYTYDQGVGLFLQTVSLPAVLVNRSTLDDPSNVFPIYDATINDFGFADLVPTITYDNNTRVCSVDVAATFATSLNGDYRLAVVFTEDSVSGTTSGYAQNNGYAGGAHGPMGGFENLPSPVPAAQMHYDFVARTILGGFSGQAGSLPAVIAAGSTYNYSFSYTIPSAYHAQRMNVHVLLIDNGSSPMSILNAAGGPIPGALPLGGSEQTGIITQTSLYPNPSATSSTLEYTLAESGEVTINVYDAVGSLVSSQNEGTVAPGTQYATVNTESLASGLYMVELIAGDTKTLSRMAVSH